MQHSDEETLSLLALGEHASVEVETHVANCRLCGNELAALRSVVNTAKHAIDRHDATDGTPIAHIVPPDRVWEQIAAATGVGSAPRPEVLRRSVEPSVPVTKINDKISRDGKELPSPALARLPRQVGRDSRRPVFTSARVAAVAAVALVVGVLGGALGVSALRGDDATPTPQVVAATRLGGLELAPAASGKADVVDTTGGRQLDLTVSALARPDGFYEVWLIDSSVKKMVPVGVLSGDSGRFSLPADLNLADYPLVDISIEPLDGNPAHSGKSVLRGTLPS